MGLHDQYGKNLLRRAFGANFDERPAPEYLSHEGIEAGSINIDGTIYDDIAVEVESRVSKQVRGAVLDLIIHPRRRKLLVLIEAHINSNTAAQARHIFSRFCSAGTWEVVTIKGSGDRPNQYLEDDTRTLVAAAERLRKKKK